MRSYYDANGDAEKPNVTIIKREGFKLMLTGSAPLGSLLEGFEDLLRGHGFCFKGELTVVDEEDEA